MKKIFFLLLLFFTVSLSGYSQWVNGMFQQNGLYLPYKISFPENYDENKKYPLLVFLHGAGERGNNNESQLANGGDFLLEHAKSKYPAIVIAPQCPENSYWGNMTSNTIGNKRYIKFGVSDTPSSTMNILIGLINDWLESGKVDQKQVYIGGLSMGGMGTFEILWRMPQTFAAAFAICGGGNTEKAILYGKTTAVWIFHGDADSVIPVENSRRMYKALENVGCDVKYTEYPGVNHGSWDNAFKEANLFPWLFSHKK